MSEIKKIEPVSGWVELELETKLIDPPVLKVKVRPLTDLDTIDAYAEGDRKLSAISLTRSLEAIAEWDLTCDGQPLPCTPETKKEYAPFLRLLLAQQVKPGPEDTTPTFLATEIQNVASDEATFLKN